VLGGIEKDTQILRKAKEIDYKMNQIQEKMLSEAQASLRFKLQEQAELD